MKLEYDFYQNDTAEHIAPRLLGMKLSVLSQDGLCSGRIVETEAYHQSEKACHAFNARRTRRTNGLFMPGGFAYVYLCYGIHSLFNVVTGKEGIAEAVLIRSVEPLEGQAIMKKRRKLSGRQLSNGPGKLSQALGISTRDNLCDLTKSHIWLEDDLAKDFNILQGKRIGIDYAEEDVDLPWRFGIEGSKCLSKEF